MTIIMEKEIVAGEGLYNEYLCKVSDNGKVILAINTDTQIIYKKVGNSWQQLPTPEINYMTDIELNHTGDVIYITINSRNNGDLYKSMDGGENWTLITSYLIDEVDTYHIEIEALATNNTGQHVLIAAEYDYEDINTLFVSVSHDYGVTWKRVEGIPPTTWYFAAEMNESGSTMLVSGVYESDDPEDQLGIGISTDFGETWRFTNMGLSTLWAYSVACSESGQIIFVGGENEISPIIFISEDYGYTWAALNQPPPENGSLHANSILCDSSGNKLIAYWAMDTVYVNDHNEFFYSEDRGQNWERVQLSEEETFSDWTNWLNIDMSRDGKVIALGTQAKRWNYTLPYDIRPAHVWISGYEPYHIKAISTALFGETIKKVAGVTKDELSKVSTQEK